jgi:hypothetical protein
VKPAAIILPLVLAACAATPEKPRVSAGQVLAQAQCPWRIASAEAWVNMMPGPGHAARQLQVAIRLQSEGDKVMLLKADKSPPGVLALELRQATSVPIEGQAAYREPISDPLPTRIVFICRSGEIAAISKIEKVY